jgi:hypothetical protein
MDERVSFCKTDDGVNVLVDAASIITFLIISFSLALVLIMKRDTLPPPMKRPLALLAIILVSFSFFLVVYSFFHTS